MIRHILFIVVVLLLLLIPIMVFAILQEDASDER